MISRLRLLLLMNFSFDLEMLRIIFTRCLRDLIIAPSTSSSFFSFRRSIFSSLFSSNCFSLFSKNCCNVNNLFSLISSISFSFCLHSLVSCSLVNLFLKLKFASSERGGNASLKALFSLALAINSMSCISTGKPAP